MLLNIKKYLLIYLIKHFKQCEIIPYREKDKEIKKTKAIIIKYKNPTNLIPTG